MKTGRIKELISKIFGWLSRPTKDSIQHYAAGAVIGAFFYIVFPFIGLWSILFVFAAALVKDILIDVILMGGQASLSDIAHTIYGGLTIEAFILLHNLLW